MSDDTSFSDVQMTQLKLAIRAGIEEAFDDIGLRIDGPEHVDDAREDFRFLRKLRKGTDSYASKIGWAVIAAVVGGAIWLFTLGLDTWRGQ